MKGGKTMTRTTQKDLELTNEGFRIGHDPKELIRKLGEVFTKPEDLRTAESYAQSMYQCRSLEELKQVGQRIDTFLKGRGDLTENPFAYHFIAYAKMVEAQNLFGGFTGADTFNANDAGYTVRCPFL
jgi:hypothetical protein